MRLEKTGNILRLVQMLSSSAAGITLEDIKEEFNCSRRTAERMLNLVKTLYDVNEAPSYDNFKHWHIPYKQLYSSLLSFNASELATLNKAITMLKNNNASSLAKDLQDLEAKLYQSLSPNKRTKIDMDLDSFKEFQEVAFYAGPNTKVLPNIINPIKEAILSFHKMNILYKANGKEETWYEVEPYGLLYGKKTYLVTYLQDEAGYRYFSLSKIKKTKISTNTFIRNENFSLKKFNEQSFGVFQEEPYNIVWKVLPEAAEEARDFCFHPSQKIKTQEDGSLIIEMKAGGLKEMCHHLFTWEGKIEIISPVELQSMMSDIVKKFL